jgi:4-hydroxybenzoate polyprenyltransferase/phosphoserine phosphatase
MSAATPVRTIVVDLDGTLVHTDMLVENMFLFLRRHPLRVLQLFAWLFQGKATFKRRLAEAVLPDVESLPYNQALLDWLSQQRSSGARLVLATASDHRIADRVGEHLRIFDEVLGTHERNLSSGNKRDTLVERFGERGFEYVGNSHADVAVWRAARVIHVAEPERGVLAAARRLDVEMGETFQRPLRRASVLARALRLHQWAKNLLIFVPLLTAHRFSDPDLLLNAIVAFVVFGACASSVYLLNDLLDLADDRRHPTKRLRPLAAGTLPIFHSLLWIPALLVGAFAASAWLLPPLFTAVLVGYFLVTLVYSLWLKRVVMLDVVTLAVLYTVRVIAGAAATSLEVTAWVLAFCMFIFLSLAFVKRYTELEDARKAGKDELTSRGYFPGDFELLASLGGASGYIAVLVLALYIHEVSGEGTLYGSPGWLWLICPLLLYWLGRVWLLAHRGQMNDDPIVFALRDKVSRGMGIAFLVIFALASW